MSEQEKQETASLPYGRWLITAVVVAVWMVGYFYLDMRYKESARIVAQKELALELKESQVRTKTQQKFKEEQRKQPASSAISIKKTGEVQSAY